MPDLRALERRLRRLEHGGGGEAKRGDSVVAQAHDEFGRAGLGFHGHVGGAAHLHHHAADGFGGAVECVEIFAAQGDDDFGGRTGKRLLHALDEEGHDLEREAGKLQQRLADLGDEHLRFFAAHLGQLDVHLAVVRTEGVFAQFGAARLLCDRDDAFVLQQFSGHALAHLQRMFERRTGHRRLVQHEVAFAELR